VATDLMAQYREQHQETSKADKRHDAAAHVPSASPSSLRKDIDVKLDTESSEVHERMNAKSTGTNLGGLSRYWRYMQDQKRLGVGRTHLSALDKTVPRQVPPCLSTSKASKHNMVSAKKRPLFLVADPFVLMSSGSKLGGGLCTRPKTWPAKNKLQHGEGEVVPISETLPALSTSSHPLADAVLRGSEQQQRLTKQRDGRGTTQTVLFLPVLSSGSCPTARSSFASRPITPMDASLVALSSL